MAKRAGQRQQSIARHAAYCMARDCLRSQGRGCPLSPDAGQMMRAEAGGQLTAVVEVVAQDVEDDLLARGWAEDSVMAALYGGLLIDEAIPSERCIPACHRKSNKFAKG